MLCKECGTENPDTNRFCRNCGKTLNAAKLVPAQAKPAPPSPSQAVPAVKKSRLSGGVGLGMAAIIIGAFSWFRYPYLLGILAIIIGVVTLSRSETRKGKAGILAAVGLLVGLASIVTDIFYFTIFPSPKLVF